MYVIYMRYTTVELQLMRLIPAIASTPRQNYAQFDGDHA